MFAVYLVAVHELLPVFHAQAHLCVHLCTLSCKIMFCLISMHLKPTEYLLYTSRIVRKSAFCICKKQRSDELGFRAG